MLTAAEVNRRLEALGCVRLNWAETPDDIWDPTVPHVEGLQPEAERSLIRGIREARDSAASCPLGLALQGRKGVGKSHLLGWVRRQINRDGGYFFLVQYLAGTEFWRSAVQGILDGLLRRMGTTSEDQLTHLLKALGATADCLPAVEHMVSQGNEPSRELLDMLVAGVCRIDRQVGHQVQDTLRALVLYGSTGPAAEIGHAVLSTGQYLEAAELAPWGIRSTDHPAQLVLRDLSRLLALTGPSVLAVDQIDTLLAPYVRNAAFNGPADSVDAEGIVLDRIADGLMSLREETRRTFSVVTCLPTSWEIIRTRAVDTVPDRFHVEVMRDVVPGPDLAREVVAGRLTSRYAEIGFTPAYPTWPVLPQAFDDAPRYTIRSVLRRVEEHVIECLAAGEVTELERLIRPGEVDELHGLEARSRSDHGRGLAGGAVLGESVQSLGTSVRPQEDASVLAIDNEFDRLLADNATGDFRERIGVNADDEDRTLPPLLDAALACLSVELKQSGHRLERDPYQKRKPDLHARLRLCLDTETEDELHWAFRAVLSSNARAVQTRIHNAQVRSGVATAEHGARRKLILLRHDPWPNGRVTLRTLEGFQAAGGILRDLSDQDLRVMAALRILTDSRRPGLDAWLCSRRPASALNALHDVVEDLAALTHPESPAGLTVPSSTGPQAPFGGSPVPSPRLPADPGPQAQDPQAADHPPMTGPGPVSVSEPVAVPSQDTTGPAFDPLAITVGRDLRDGRPVTVPLEALRKHVVVFAGSGSGKTVLLRRIIEECAVRGVSSVVLDINNDLARLGDPWPQPPQQWNAGDAELAEDYLRRTEVVIWTPGRPSGRPLSFRPLPDFTRIRDDEEELADAVAAAVASLEPRAGLTGRTRKTEWGKAVLRNAVDHLAREGRSDLTDLIDMLRDLPEGVSGISRAGALAAEAAESLEAARVNDRLFDPGTSPIDAGSLLEPSEGKRARVSVISLAGLASDEEQQGLVNRLQMALFSWIKQHPARGRPLRGLLVLDEAQNYAPSGRTTPCSYSTTALVAQARKYGLGLVFATQSPKGLDNKIPANSATQFFGHLNAPVQIEAAHEIARARGGGIEKIGHLLAGQFFVSGEGKKFQRITTPFCLTHHPQDPLTTEEVLLKAAGADSPSSPGVL